MQHPCINHHVTFVISHWTVKAETHVFMTFLIVHGSLACEAPVEEELTLRAPLGPS